MKKTGRTTRGTRMDAVLAQIDADMATIVARIEIERSQALAKPRKTRARHAAKAA